jgi:hypothetical protein
VFKSVGIGKSIGIGALALALSACGAPRPRPPAVQNPGESAWRTDLPHTGRPYRIDGAQSELRILVYRAGSLARFGHNHVMVNRALRGSVNVAETPGASGFWLNVPAADFVVDDAQARAEEGADFAAEVPDDAKSGTLQNMLGAAVLDAAEFPQITVRSVAISSPQVAIAAQDAAGPSGLTATLAVSVAGHESRIDAPFNLQSDPQQVSATGTVQLRQTDLGMTPYSLMLGALQVQDMVTIKFKIIALPE